MSYLHSAKRYFISQFIAIQILLPWVAFADDQGQPVLLTVNYVDSLDPYFKKRDAYFIEVLKLALEHSDRKYTLNPVQMLRKSENRQVINIKSGLIDVQWLHTLESIEAELLPIRIPLLKGLIGWRLMLVHKDNIDLLKDVKTLEQLKKYSVLQSYDWPDTKILNANGFKVQSSVEFSSLFRMLEYRRADMFPRSIVEIWGEPEDQDSVSISIDPHIILRYPTAYYFFVDKRNKNLYSAIEQGLNRAISDGSFEVIFNRYFAAMIEKANISKRTIIDIKNPYLPALTPLSRRDFWFEGSSELMQSLKHP